MRKTTALVLLLAFAAPAAAGDALSNPSFEGADGLEGWTAGQGARNAAPGGESVVGVDRKVARDGKASLHLSGDATTATWHMVTQQAEVAPGRRVVFRVAARCRGVRREGSQYVNANALLLFRDAAGARLGLSTSAQLSGDRDWVDLVVHAIAPPGAARLEAGVFLSQSGDAWFDDARLTIAPCDAADPEARRAAFELLEDHLLTTYPFWGIDGRPDPGKLFDRHRRAALKAKDESAFVGTVQALLAELADVHVHMDVHGTPWYGVRGNPHPANFRSADPGGDFTRALVQPPAGLAGRFGVGDAAIGYLRIDSFDARPGHTEQLETAFDALRDVRGLILDLRRNGGGAEPMAARVAGRLTGERRLYARHVVRDPTLPRTEGFGPPGERWLEPVAPRFPADRKVVVLQGPYCVSSTEGFLLMVKGLAGVTTVGLPSRGASGNPGPFDLLPGVRVFASRWRSLDPSGQCIEGVGVGPDVSVEAPPAAYRAGDPTLERALKLLGQ